MAQRSGRVPSRAVSARSRRAARVGTCLTLVVATTGATALVGGLLARQSLETRTVDTGDALAPDTGGATNYLVVGSDSREGIVDDGSFGDVGGRRSDTMMVLRVDPAAGRAALLSLPRDLFVEIAGTDSSDRLNAAYPRGAGTLVETVEDNFGIPIHHYLEVDLVGFSHLVDAVGGVPTCFELPVRDEGSGLLILEPGCYDLDGATALQYARSRTLQTLVDGEWQTDGSADLGRIARQQAFMKDALKQAVRVSLTHPTAVADLSAIVGQDLVADDGFALGRFGASMRDIDLDAIATFTPPVEDDQVGDRSVLRVRDDEAAPLFALFAEGSLAELPAPDDVEAGDAAGLVERGPG